MPAGSISNGRTGELHRPSKDDNQRYCHFLRLWLRAVEQIKADTK